MQGGGWYAEINFYPCFQLLQLRGLVYLEWSEYDLALQVKDTSTTLPPPPLEALILGLRGMKALSVFTPLLFSQTLSLNKRFLDILFEN